ncbi:MAG TPA: c-type cytochrome [Gemmatimonadaceae bacterium]|nr:c-type cytochrome [Gemmatimonadaceae bacterium]
MAGSVSCVALAAAAGCGGESRAAQGQQGPPRQAQGTAAGSAGDSGRRFVEHPDHIPAGFPSRDRPLALTNPYEGDRRALQTGGQLFISYNCIDCHGAEGSGAMGPSLADGRWHFGGSPAEVFESIYQGRPEGMPAWGGRIADDQIWMLVSYVRSLGAGKDVSTENFTGATVERSGH